MYFDEMFYEVIKDYGFMEFSPYRCPTGLALATFRGEDASIPLNLDRLVVYGFYNIYDMAGKPNIPIERLSQEVMCIDRMPLMSQVNLTLPSKNYFMDLVTGNHRNAAVVAMLPDEGQQAMVFCLSGIPHDAWSQFRNLDIWMTVLGDHPKAYSKKNIPDKLGEGLIVNYIQTLTHLGLRLF